MVFKLERLEALRTAESSLLDTHRPDTVSSSSGGSGISRHLAEPTGVTATASGYVELVVFGFHRRHR